MPQVVALKNVRQRACLTCDIWKDRSEFTTHPGGKIHSECKECARPRLLAYKKAFGNQVQPSGLTRNQEGKLRLAYGISGAEFAALLKAQGYKCKCCGGPFAESKSKRPMHVDHSHKTGKLRGILCGGCNLMLGHAKDSIEMLLHAVEYLKKEGF